MVDGELLVSWRGGDERAGEVLVRRHYSAIERFFINKAHDHAADLIQRTFLALLEARDRIRDGDVRRYLFGIARNVLLDHIRRVVRTDRRIDFGTHSVQDLSPTPSTQFRNNQRAQQLLDALRQIPLELQIVLELYYWEDMSARELAEALDIPEGSVRTKIRMAKEKLARKMKILARDGDLRQTAATLDSWAREVREQLVQGRPEEPSAAPE